MTIGHVVTLAVFGLMVGGALLAGRSRRKEAPQEAPRPRVLRRWHTRRFWQLIAIWLTLPH